LKASEVVGISKLVLENVTKRFGNHVAVDDLSLEIDEQSFFSLLGPSGCGKTTTIRLIAGLEHPDTGRILIDDHVIFDSASKTVVPSSQRKLGMVFQSYALWPHMTVKENVMFGLQVRGVARAEQERRFVEVSETLSLEGLGGRYPNELSGGQQQRIALARELVTGARILLMDEPLSNLDAQLRIDMRSELKRLHERTGQTIIYVTHDQVEALTLASKMAVLKEGVLQQCAHPDEVYFAPANRFVASFIGNIRINLLPARLALDGIVGDGYRLPYPSDRQELMARAPLEVVLGLRPEEIMVVDERDPWTVPCVVHTVLHMGSVGLLHLGIAEAAEAVSLHVQYARERSVRSGDQVLVKLPETALMVFDAESGERLGDNSAPEWALRQRQETR
jgi:ABC-type sugar transport system ATPase subunit